MELYNPEYVQFHNGNSEFGTRSKNLVVDLNRGMPLTQLVDGGGFYHAVYQCDDYPDLVVKRLKTATVPSYFQTGATLGQIWMHLMNEHDIVATHLPTHTPNSNFVVVRRQLIDCTGEEIDYSGMTHFAGEREFIVVQENIADRTDLHWGPLHQMLNDGYDEETFLTAYTRMAQQAKVLPEDQFAYSSSKQEVMAIDTNQLVSFRGLTRNNPLLEWLGVDTRRIHSSRQLAQIVRNRLYFPSSTIDYIQYQMAEEHYLYAELVAMVSETTLKNLDEEQKSFLLINGLARIWHALSLFPSAGENRYARIVRQRLFDHWHNSFQSNQHSH
ncbi:hypothetical protein KC909_03985 [Candidatus Dojkabacteria bacterium]|uniref:Uncharacterized protein n=1 Tax=Candidatus Dojkabacteria bacterium TaxID=2099670 RepID=A0A955L5M4_9BACT|nr:hypothetical protein [Candidatus Dojkabacteria bacterium]